MLFSTILEAYRNCPRPVRQTLSGLKRACRKISYKVQMEAIPVEACLFGTFHGVSQAALERLFGDIRRASRRVSEWEHVKLLRQYESMGDQLWEPGVFEQTEYYQAAVLNIELAGRYFDAVTFDQIQRGAKRFVNWYRGSTEFYPLQVGQSDEKNSNEYITLQPIDHSRCYEVIDGHHRLAIAYMKGVHKVKACVRPGTVTTPLQELLLDVLYGRLKARRELNQPVESPEVEDWLVVRRCADRLAKVTRTLQAEGLMPDLTSSSQPSYLDVGSNYGWFVAEMAKAGFRAEGVERDPSAIAVGQVMYGLSDGRLHRSDAAGFLRAVEEKFDVTSCMGLLHHYILERLNVSASELLGLLDAATRHVMFFDMGQSHENFFAGKDYLGWNPDSVEQWLKDNTTFTRILRLGPDEDAAPPFEKSYGRMLFACMR